MKKKSNLMTTVLFSVLLIFSTSFSWKPDVSITKFYDPVGIWDYEVETDEGTLTGVMNVGNDDEGELEISVETDDFGTLELEDIELKDVKLTASVELEGDVIGFEFEFDGDSMEGIVSTPDGDLDITAERRKKK